MHYIISPGSTRTRGNKYNRRSGYAIANQTYKFFKDLTMNKNSFNPIELKKIIQTTQAIEGYKPASLSVVKKVQQLRQQYGIQVSPRK